MAAEAVQVDNDGHCFPALAALLFRENSSNSSGSSDGAVGDSVEAGAFDFLKLEQPAFVVHCICDFYVDL